eukprot:Pompholyxophrys_sp_v1_NODE_55_length_2838_cov_7.592526.p3 type:complete len:101 gc:universal NODE_55_length_2838_cov_7.592526:2513-2211(-)
MKEEKKKVEEKKKEKKMRRKKKRRRRERRRNETARHHQNISRFRDGNFGGSKTPDNSRIHVIKTRKKSDVSMKKREFQVKCEHQISISAKLFFEKRDFEG